MWGVWRRRRSQAAIPDDEVGEEFRDHLRRRTADLVARGLTPEAASRQAAIEFGGVENYKEQTRHVARGGAAVIFFEQVWLELTRAVRRLARTPVFTGFAILSIAIGVGITTAAYAVLENSRRQLEMPNADRVVLVRSGPVWLQAFGADEASEILNSVRSLQPLASASKVGADFQLDSHTAPIDGESVSGDYFAVAGARALRGRLLGPLDDVPSAPGVVVIGERFWKERLGSSANIVGSVGTFCGQPVTVVGIVPETFSGLEASPLHPVQLWISYAAARQIRLLAKGGWHGISPRATIFGRLAPGRELTSATAELSGLGSKLDLVSNSLEPATREPHRVWSATTVAAVQQASNAKSRPGELVVLVVVGLILGVASTNLANLLMARRADQQQERAIFSALGASQTRIFSGILVEPILLAGFGGIGAVLVTQIAMVVCSRYLALGLWIVSFAPHWDRSVATLELLLLALSFLCFGLVPAWRVSRSSFPPLPSRRPVRLRGSWIAGQVATASALLLVAIMCIRQLEVVWRHDTGIDYLSTDIAILSSLAGSDDQNRMLQVEHAIMEAVERRPEFQSASVSSTLPFGLVASQTIRLTAADNLGTGPGAATEEETLVNASPSIFRTLDISIIRGRALDEFDRPALRPNVVIGEQAARHLFGSLDIVGREVLLQSAAGRPGGPANTLAVVVGVAEATDNQMLFSRVRDAIYVPLGQYAGTDAVVVARTSEPDRNAETLAHTIRSVDPDATVWASSSGRQALAGDYILLSPIAGIASAIALIALLLAACGLYGLLLEIVKRRYPEMGLRIALGAHPSHLTRMIIRQGIRPVLWGLPIGLFGAILGRRLIQRSHPITAELLDPLALAAASVPFILAALVACYWPARRASRVDPTVVLRAE